MNQEIQNTYNTIIFNYYRLSNNELNLLVEELNLLTLALYLKNILKDSRDILVIKQILKEYYGRSN